MQVHMYIGNSQNLKIKAKIGNGQHFFENSENQINNTAFFAEKIFARMFYRVMILEKKMSFIFLAKTDTI